MGCFSPLDASRCVITFHGDADDTPRSRGSDGSGLKVEKVTVAESSSRWATERERRRSRRLVNDFITITSLHGLAIIGLSLTRYPCVKLFIGRFV